MSGDQEFVEVGWSWDQSTFVDNLSYKDLVYKFLEFVAISFTWSLFFEVDDNQIREN